MTFLNLAILAGLAAVGIPILIHLLNRRRAKLEDWGAMQFLLASLASRNRRILIEEMILMALRCLLVALLVLAMARPFLPARSAVPWAVVLPAVLVAAMCIGVAAATWALRRVRWWLVGIGCGLLLVAAGASIFEHIAQWRRWSSPAGAKDIAVIVDGSMSMGLEVGGKSNFAQAVEEARLLADARRGSDAVALVAAGSVPRAVLAAPTSNDKDIAAALDAMQPAGGSLRVLEALNAAAVALGRGHNPGKRIVLITDGQNVGWDLASEARWRFLAAGLDNLPSRPEIICRMLPMPEAFRNAAVVGVTLSRRLIGTDRPVDVDVKVMNTGTAPLAGVTVEMLVDEVPAGRRATGEIAVNAAETVSFTHRFKRPGPRVVTARIVERDDLPADNVSHRVACVLAELRVLVVDGGPSLGGWPAATYIALAMNPPEEPPARPRAKRSSRKEIGRLIKPRVVPASRLASAGALGDWHVVVLADVAKLPNKPAAALGEYVHAGGGLLIAPGRRAKLGAGDDIDLAPFYNNWKGRTGQPLCPARLAARQDVRADPARLAVRTFTHPALELIADEKRADAEQALVTAYWRLDADDRDPDVRIAALLDTGEPFMVERRVGRGRVIVTAVSLDRRDSNLPTLNSFLPLMHELTYYLAEPAVPAGNVRCGSQAVAELMLRKANAPPGQIPPGGVINVRTPSGQTRPGAVLAAARKLRLRFDETYEPGLYRFRLPGPLARAYAANTPDGNTVPFVAVRRAAESRMERLAEADLAGPRSHVRLLWAESYDEAAAMVAGEVPGEELWKYLAAAALAALVGEIMLTRWIAAQRRSHRIETVAFGDESMDVETFRHRARRMLAGAAESE